MPAKCEADGMIGSDQQKSLALELVSVTVTCSHNGRCSAEVKQLCLKWAIYLQTASAVNWSRRWLKLWMCVCELKNRVENSVCVLCDTIAGWIKVRKNIWGYLCERMLGSSAHLFRFSGYGCPAASAEHFPLWSMSRQMCRLPAETRRQTGRRWGTPRHTHAGKHTRRWKYKFFFYSR